MNKWVYILLVISSCHSVAKLNVVTENFPPAQYLNEHNELKGHLADKVRKALNASLLDYSISVYSWSTAFNMVLRDSQTCIFSISRSAERENKLLWIAELSGLDAYFYALKSKNIKVDSLEQAKNYRIAVLKDNYSHQYLVSKGFEEGKNLLLINSFDNISKIIHNRKNSIDLVILPKQRAEFELASQINKDHLQPLFKLNKEQPSLYFACNKKIEPNLIKKLTLAFSTTQ